MGLIHAGPIGEWCLIVRRGATKQEADAAAQAAARACGEPVTYRFNREWLRAEPKGGAPVLRMKKGA